MRLVIMLLAASMLLCQGCSRKTEEVTLLIGTDNQKRSIHAVVDIDRTKVKEVGK